ncbi:MAG: thiamine pyrophosphate-dependent dehydrogenase E1 component subunit alpha [Luteitalea sp.]|nr:thiamine pyrophosphate-dependent dehydrogenase E1 component subunit alpha [Luteitalea sp.]
MLDRTTLLELYYYARLTRDVEERLAILYRTNQVVGGLYRSLGQEGESVASALALEPSDIIGPLIRNLGSLLARGVRPRDIFAQYMARGASPSRGRDLNLHFSHIPPAASGEPTIIGPISMLGDLIPVVAGALLGGRMQQRRLVALTYIGDGGTSTGAFHEGMNFAAVQRLPLVVIAEDNKFAYSTPIARQMAIERIDQRAEAYGVAHEMVDGNDMIAVYEATKRAVDRGRRGEGATLIGVDTMRMRGHAEHDDMRYVPKAMLEQWTTRDPIAKLRTLLVELSLATDTDLHEIDRRTRSFAEAEANDALAQPRPDPADVTRDLYAGTHPFPGRRVELVRSPFREL